MRIASGGAPIILCFLLLHLVFLLSSWLTTGRLQAGWPTPSLAILSALFALLTVFSLYFFRDPERQVPEGDHLVVSPADGRVLAVEQVERLVAVQTLVLIDEVK